MMRVPYQLTLYEPEHDITKFVGENVFLADLPVGYPVYAFYYPAEMPNNEFESLLRKFGERTGSNLFVNIGRLNDPQFDKIVREFEIKSFPSVVLTAVADLAAPENAFMNTYVRLDARLLAEPDRAITLLENLYLLFLKGDIADAIRRTKWKNKTELLRNMDQFVMKMLGKVGSFVADRDLSISILQGRFEIKKSG